MFNFFKKSSKLKAKFRHTKAEKSSIINVSISCDKSGDFETLVDIQDFSDDAMFIVGKLMHIIDSGKLTPVLLEVYKDIADQSEQQKRGMVNMLESWDLHKQEELSEPCIDPFEVFNLTNISNKDKQ